MIVNLEEVINGQRLLEKRFQESLKQVEERFQERLEKLEERTNEIIYSQKEMKDVEFKQTLTVEYLGELDPELVQAFLSCVSCAQRFNNWDDIATINYLKCHLSGNALLWFEQTISLEEGNITFNEVQERLREKFEKKDDISDAFSKLVHLKYDAKNPKQSLSQFKDNMNVLVTQGLPDNVALEWFLSNFASLIEANTFTKEPQSLEEAYETYEAAMEKRVQADPCGSPNASSIKNCDSKSNLRTASKNDKFSLFSRYFLLSMIYIFAAVLGFIAFVTIIAIVTFWGDKLIENFLRFLIRIGWIG